MIARVRPNDLRQHLASRQGLHAGVNGLARPHRLDAGLKG